MSAQTRQGDVLLVAVEAIPEKARRRRGRMVLAEGEATGHAHVLTPAAGGQAELLAMGDRLFARVLAGDARVLHEEHGDVILPPGEYEIVRQREFVPAPAGMPRRFATTRRVAD